MNRVATRPGSRVLTLSAGLLDNLGEQGVRHGLGISEEHFRVLLVRQRKRRHDGVVGKGGFGGAIMQRGVLGLVAGAGGGRRRFFFVSVETKYLRRASADEPNTCCKSQTPEHAEPDPVDLLGMQLRLHAHPFRHRESRVCYLTHV